MLGSLVRTALTSGSSSSSSRASLLAFGIDATRKLSVDAFPDVTNVQVQVATEVPGTVPGRSRAHGDGSCGDRHDRSSRDDRDALAE